MPVDRKTRLFSQAPESAHFVGDLQDDQLPAGVRAKENACRPERLIHEITGKGAL